MDQSRDLLNILSTNCFVPSGSPLKALPLANFVAIFRRSVMTIEHIGLLLRAGSGIYIVLALFYTTLHFWLLLIGPSHLRSPTDLVWAPTSHGLGELGEDYTSPFSINASKFPSDMSVLEVEDFLSSSAFSSFNVKDSKSIIAENTFLSRAFPRLMQPMKIIPFYYKSTGDLDREDITITTLVTSNRFPVLKQLVERYQGAFFE
jgi:hypothetical protein